MVGEGEGAVWSSHWLSPPPGDAIRLLYELRQAIITVLLLYSQHHYSTKLWAQLWLIATIIHMYVYKGTSYS